MARAFLHEGGRYVAILDDTERTVLSGLMQQTRILLSPEVESTGDVFDDLAASMGVSLDREAEATAAAGDPDVVELRDPALDRLLPDAHRGDDDIAAEFRRLTEEGLRQRKSSNLDVALARLAESVKDRVELGPDDAPAFLMALTDVRLLLGERMGMLRLPHLAPGDADARAHGHRPVRCRDDVRRRRRVGRRVGPWVGLRVGR